MTTRTCVKCGRPHTYRHPRTGLVTGACPMCFLKALDTIFLDIAQKDGEPDEFTVWHRGQDGSERTEAAP